MVWSLIGLSAMIFLSCSGRGGAPILPQNEALAPELTDLRQSDESIMPDSQTNVFLWGIYDVVFDEGLGEFVIEPIRNAQFTFNILYFLQPPDGDPANLAIKITDKTKLLTEGKLTLDVTVKHPINKPNLVGFDTMGVLMGNGSIPFTGDPGVVMAGANDLYLLNADGYTRWMNQLEFTTPGLSGYTEGKLGTKGQTWSATVNGYKYFADGLDKTASLPAYLDANIAKRGAFLPNTTNVRSYEIKFPMVGGAPSLKFQYAILTNFKGAKDAQGKPIPNPKISDFPAGANALEAVCIVPNTSESTLYCDKTKMTSGGDLKLTLKIYDWQGMPSLGGTGVFNQIDSIGLSSPDGIFSTGGYTFYQAALSGTQIASTENSTTLSLTVSSLAPTKNGVCELLIAVYSKDPTGYGPNFGSAYPTNAKLAGYARTTVSVSDTDPNPPVNYSPVIDSIEGLTEVTCWDGQVLYTCNAHDPNPGDILMYQWEVVVPPMFPMFMNPPSPNNTVTVDWSDEGKYPAGEYEVYFRVADDKGAFVIDKAVVNKSVGSIKANPIAADMDDIQNVLCTNVDAKYTGSAEHCVPGGNLQYRFLRKAGDPPAMVNPKDPDWTEWSDKDFVIYSWDNTAIGKWWMVFNVRTKDQTTQTMSPFLIITRVDTPPTNPNPPQGQTTVNCNNTLEQYELTGGNDCDGGTTTRKWTLTQTPETPTGGWAGATGNVFYVDWSKYPLGKYYLWQRVGDEPNFSISEPLEVSRVNTPPDKPQAPTGKPVVNCKDTGIYYQAGTVYDCENDALTRQWALTTGNQPPTSGWVQFTGVSFIINFSTYPNGNYKLYQRASDDAGQNWSVSDPLSITKTNTAPNNPSVPSGATEVTCYDTDESYNAGNVSDCDVGDVLKRYWGISYDILMPPSSWEEFSGTTFKVDWSKYMTTTLYLWQRAFDGLAESISNPLSVTKLNSAPQVTAPVGPSLVDCTSTAAEYFETVMSDCDLMSDLIKNWYLSTDPVQQVNGEWIFYSESSFLIDFSNKPSGDYYLFLKASDGQAETISSPLHILKVNSAPAKPGVPEGLSEITCETNPAWYNGGKLSDCDSNDTLTRYYYISTNAVTPTGGAWILVEEQFFQVDFTGVPAEQQLYLFQKVSDGTLETISDSLPVIYHNTSPYNPFAPSGENSVSCANDNEPYNAGEAADCDTWQTLTRQWATNTVNTPPASGWVSFTGNTFYVNWSLYTEGTYFLFQRVYDGFQYAWSSSTQITVNPPTLIKPSQPSGNNNIYCDGPIETYIAGSYLLGCPGINVIREWAFNTVPTAPVSGWVEFSGTTFNVDPSTLGVGYRYLFQRARLDGQKQTSDPLLIQVQPGYLGKPPVPSGSTSIGCNSVSEPYNMGVVDYACPGTNITRKWQVQNSAGQPLGPWTDFTSSPVYINWTSYPMLDSYRLVQRASDGVNEKTSDPLTVYYLNDEPDFLGSINGPTAVGCSTTNAQYNCGEISDCDPGQSITREWAWNTINAYPATGWTVMTGSSFVIDFSDPIFQPGNYYLFQRAGDGKVVVYDPTSLHVVYSNSPPEQPSAPTGMSFISCFNLIESYNGGEVFDCDSSNLTRQWAASTVNSPPATGWNTFTGNSFQVNWAGVAKTTWYLFQRVSDGQYTVTSPSLQVNVINAMPVLNSFTCDQGSGSINSDGMASGLPGLSLHRYLDYSFSLYDCDGDTLSVYWALATAPLAPPEGDPSWNGPLANNYFTIDTSPFTGIAPSTLYVFIGVNDGATWSSFQWTGSINLWKRIWFTDFASAGDMWNEHACLTGTGSYNWSYDAGNDYLRLTEYGPGSNSAVWSDTITFPQAPLEGSAVLYSYLNPALSTVGFDHTYFSFLRDAGCQQSFFDIFPGNGCDSSSPTLKQFSIDNGLFVWNNTARVGIIQNGVDGCITSDYWIDWVGMWIRL